MKNLTLFLALVALMLSVYAQEPLFTESKVNFYNDYALWIVTMEFKGTHEQIGVAMKTFVDEFFSQKLVPMGPPVGIFPKEQIQLEGAQVWQLGFPVQEKIEVKAPLSIRMIHFPKVARYIHKGVYANIGKVHTLFEANIQTRGLASQKEVVLRYLDDPSKMLETEVRTEILIPLQAE